jgi:hypothetical protein
MATPRKGKAKVKITASGKKVSYGQAGKALQVVAQELSQEHLRVTHIALEVLV